MLDRKNIVLEGWYEINVSHVECNCFVVGSVNEDSNSAFSNCRDHLVISDPDNVLAWFERTEKSFLFHAVMRRTTIC